MKFQRLLVLSEKDFSDYLQYIQGLIRYSDLKNITEYSNLFGVDLRNYKQLYFEYLIHENRKYVRCSTEF